MHIRPACAADREAILMLVPRLAEHGTPPGRDRQQIEDVDRDAIAAVVVDRSPEVELLVAEEDGEVVGFVHVRTVTDYYTQTPIGHVSDVVVAAKAQGKGVGHALIERAQAWARTRGYPMMQLFVLPENAGARALYEHMGYRAEWLKYVKMLSRE